MSLSVTCTCLRKERVVECYHRLNKQSNGVRVGQVSAAGQNELGEGWGAG